MSSRIFQSLILQMKDSSNRVIGVLDGNGTIVACSDLSRIGEKRESITSEITNAIDPVIFYDGYSYRALASWGIHHDFIAFVEGTDEIARSNVMLVAIALNGAKSFYDEKHDKNTFIKNILLDNILPGDIYIRSRELHFTDEVPYTVFLIRQIDRVDLGVYDVIQSLFPDRQHDFVISINDWDIVLVKEVSANVDNQQMKQIASEIEQTINSELYIKTVIGIGTVAYHLKDLASAYKEAQVAIEVGKVFDTEKTIIHYDTLGIGRLIYQLPTTMCEMFLSEVFKKNSIDSLDQETLFTINKFFENNLNVSETSRKLFVHRNTLVYRLEKIKKLTGLDLREFDHAIVFKVALMVKRYLQSRESNF